MTSNKIPSGYTFLNTKCFVSQKAADMILESLKKLNNRDPDAFDMYIYNDFFNYAQLDLVDKQLSPIHSKILKKDWTEAFHLLEALTVFLDIGAHSWPMADDGERVTLTDKVYGACLVTVLRALNKEGQLDVEHFPSLETVLSRASKWGTAMSEMGSNSSCYYIVLNGIGQRLFKDKSEEAIALEKARVEEWIKTLDGDDRKDMEEASKQNEDEDEEDEEDEEEDGPWYEQGKKSANEDDQDDDYILSRMWREYKAYLQSVPTKPLRGPPIWDLSKWSQTQRAEFSFDTY